MSWLRPCTFNIIYLVDLLGLGVVVPVMLGPCPWDVINVHLVTNKLGRCDRSHLDLGQFVHRRERVVSQTVSSELHTLRISSFDISSV